MKQIEVVAAIIHDDKGHIFATQRGDGEWKDWWEFPGGKMELGKQWVCYLTVRQTTVGFT
ncbi:MAG: mutator mutT protein [bacterium P3]|nr:MAG: mutator mutT protein [bacterium P3]KWW40065.1 MAG: mutator mutT protein [bacterium F083]